MEHTKGKWEVKIHERADGARISISTEEHQICGIEPKVCASGLITFEKHLANASLIAQAPALLEACKEYVEWFEKMSRYQNQRLGHGLKEACSNWGEASTVDFFDCSKMKQAIAEAE